MPNLSAFLSYIIITTFTPGPNNIMSMSNASKYGFKKALPFNIGVFLGCLIIFSLSSFFSAKLFEFIPSIQPIMTFIGVAYILWLAWKTYTSKPQNLDQDDKHTNSVFTGFILQFVNLKVIIYAITITSTFIIPYYNSTIIIIAFSIGLSIIGFMSTCSWAIFGSILRRFFESHSKTINTVMALLLVYTAISLLL